MKVYLVGGAVRDEILGINSSDKDYLVIDSSAKELISLGYIQVGIDFPIFLHPETKEEYSLPRGKSLNLKEDLYRRDLTINAIAKDLDSGEYIDPYSGIKDIKNKTLRHVSNHFSEDPLRVFRVARFLAQHSDFKVAAVTVKLCKEISEQVNFEELNHERIWNEIAKALLSDRADLFFGFFKNIMKTDIDFESLKHATKLCSDKNVRLASALYKSSDFNYRFPKQTKRLLEAVSSDYKNILNCTKLSDEAILEMFLRFDIFRNPELFTSILMTCEAISLGDFKQKKYLQEIELSLKELDIKTLIANAKLEGTAGKIPQLIKVARLAFIKQVTLN
jgi:tRNA nucleotidyltransferase (CCA-adding enzyme)